MARGPGKGKTNNPKGRPRGSQNRATKDVREAFKKLIENNLDNMEIWLEEVAKESPSKALQIIKDLSEYILPKLQRTELSGGDNKPLDKITFKFGDNNNRGDNTDEETK